MVEVEEIVEPTSTEASPLMSVERLLDAQELEKLATQAIRPTVRAQVTSLAEKVRRDAAALEKLEASRAKAASAGEASSSAPPQDAAPTPAPAPTPTPASTSTSAAASAPATQVRQVDVSTQPPPPPSSTAKFIPIDRFSFDAGSSSDAMVTLYVPLPNVGSIPKSNINCTFTSGSFDLTITGLDGKNYRLVKDNLDKDIVADKSTFKIRANKIILKLAKVKGEYGSFDFWTDLTAKKSKEQQKKTSSDPSAGIMDLMKEMYDNGDDKMKKMIGETMLKQRNGELNKPDMDGMGGMGGMGDLGM